MDEPSDRRDFCRETVQGLGNGQGKCIRQTGGRSLYAHVDVAVAPAERGAGTRIHWASGSNIPAGFAAPVIEGIYDVLRGGVLEGLELLDLQVSVEKGSYHDEDSTRAAFRAAAKVATTMAVRDAKPVLSRPRPKSL